MDAGKNSRHRSPKSSNTIGEKPASLTTSYGSRTPVIVGVLVVSVTMVLLTNRREFIDFRGRAAARAESASAANPAPPNRASVLSDSGRAMFDTKPPVASDRMLTLGELRYCLAESVRLLAEQQMLDGATKAQSRRYNGHVADYNSRCGKYKYERRDLMRARADIDPVREALKEEGRARLR